MTANCAICHGTGIAHRAPNMLRLRDGDLYTITVCTCEAGQAQADSVNRAVAQKNGNDHESD